MPNPRADFKQSVETRTTVKTKEKQDTAIFNCKEIKLDVILLLF